MSFELVGRMSAASSDIKVTAQCRMTLPLIRPTQTAWTRSSDAYPGTEGAECGARDDFYLDVLMSL